MIYCIGNKESGICKIGHSTDVERRFVSLKTGNHLKLEILAVIEGGYAEEQILHHRFNEFSLEGEWFTLSNEIAKFFRIENSKIVLMYDNPYIHRLKCATDYKTIILLTSYSLFNTNRVVLTSEIRQELLKTIEITTQNLSNSLKRLVIKKMLFKDNKEYRINPFTMWRGYPEYRNKYIDDNIELINKQFKINQENEQ